jgi:hypothetical protein
LSSAFLKGYFTVGDVTYQVEGILGRTGGSFLSEKHTMQVKLTANYFLTTDHAKSRFGQPVLVDRATGQAFLPSDAFAPYEFWQTMKADQIVKRMASWGTFSKAEQGLINQFLGFDNPPESPASKERNEPRDHQPVTLKWQSR